MLCALSPLRYSAAQFHTICWATRQCLCVCIFFLLRSNYNKHVHVKIFFKSIQMRKLSVQRAGVFFQNDWPHYSYNPLLDLTNREEINYWLTTAVALIWFYTANRNDNSSECLLTCELQRSAQRALRWREQRQAGVFGLGVLQTLH